ncbi:MAG: hypothetical protein AAB786_01055 [Patescibacteria group bacterium]
MDFFQRFSEIIKTLLLLNPFGDNLALKTECQEVMSLLDKKDQSQSEKYSKLIAKLFQFFDDNQIFIQESLPS